ncbi:hypothetical protein PR202_ga24619 [Eleusine coracana subsp. coracana]|uniref:F-box domain-containing protein n=1 Tax=Eleusine coracana subsp. coracana TaxID=191504 RepID=A0AAV5DA01_ELECO|nr:hypothetical protein PR202_ga24619 [Eleusine coracana subsp. coracana]
MGERMALVTGVVSRVKHVQLSSVLLIGHDEDSVVHDFGPEWCTYGQILTLTTNFVFAPWCLCTRERSSSFASARVIILQQLAQSERWWLPGRVDARLLFDRMPVKRRSVKGKGSLPPAASGDRLGTLPDDVLHHVLSFLPAQDAVRTCVLAHRWVHLWKSATSLQIVRRDVDGPRSVKAVREFVDHLLLLRGSSPLDTCKLSLSDFEEDDMSRMKLWIRHILMCKVRVLSLDICDHKLLDFSFCPALEVLEIDDSDLSCADNISSESLRCLSISRNCYFDEYSRTHIYAPNLHSLRLEIGNHRTPFLARMPSLMEAFITLCDSNRDYCESTYSGDCEDDSCFACYDIPSDTENCVLLQGLSEARNLALMADVEIFIFRRDLKSCPTFGSLKYLLLNEYWCVPADFSALAYMLEHSPILEKLTLQLFSEGPKFNVEMRGIFDPTERSAAISEYLKIVEVKCEVVDDRVLDVLKFLSKLGISGN